MNTCEMVIKADQDGKTYKTSSLFYNTRQGFHHASGDAWPASAYERAGLNQFAHEAGWKEFSPEYTMDELFEKIGHRFKIK